MTWVIAQPTLFGQVLALSDIQVTFEDDKGNKYYRDCLQKMYAIDDNLIMGFAGNVYGGLIMLGQFSRSIKNAKKGRGDLLPEPEKIINAWSPIAARLFTNLKSEAREGEIHLLIAGVSHTKDNGISGMGFPYAAVLKSPDFTPTFAKIGEWISIGSGSEVPEYKKILERFTLEKSTTLMQMEVHNPGGYASAMSILLVTNVNDEAEQKGISKHFHIAIVSRAGVYGGNSDHTKNMGESNETKVVMPTVATNPKEFEDYVNKEFNLPKAIKAIC